ncbi:PDZ domain-containing protein [Oecophyllibacter saccharovorans]|uniref:PDZ domain-containing protein n=1 Tax=Oecophyllibacter saccharovorans TaxID=2558360 RepID=A0A506ULQ7_9PROT|nr:PDZ domain-containing protein [Oecophyllibacter saccharovorans]
MSFAVFQPCTCLDAPRRATFSHSSALSARARLQACATARIAMFLALSLAVAISQAQAAPRPLKSQSPPPSPPLLSADASPSVPVQAANREGADTSPVLPAAQAAMIHNVIASALSFIQPRALKAYTYPQLCLWGLQSLTALDPGLGIHLGNGQLILTQNTPLAPGTILLTRPAPPAQDLKAWVNTVMVTLQTAWQHAPALRQKGVSALLPAFFQEIFSHFDPYSRYLSPQQAHDERAYRQGDDYSIGVKLAERPGRSPTISAININSPAWENGLDIGQTVIMVDGRSTRNVPLDTVQNWLAGAPGSNVTLTVLQQGRRKTITLPRLRLPPETVFPDRQGPYTVLHITHFSSQTAEEVSFYLSNLLPATAQGDDGDVDRALAEKKLRIPGLIIDLRGNHGGTLQQAVMTAALLLDNGIAATTEGRDPVANHVWSVQGGDMLSGSPVAVVVDGGTASAAEVLAAALADHRRAAVVGTSTFGKGLVQIIGQMPNHGEVFVTWSRNFAPLGWPIQGLGVFPQLCLSAPGLPAEAQLAALAHGRNLLEVPLRQSRAVRVETPVSEVLSIRALCPASGADRDDLHQAARLLSSSQAYQAALAGIPDDLTSPAAPAAAP